MARKTAIDLTEGPILKKMLLFAFPLILNNLVSNLYSTADMAMIGRFDGTDGMAAIGASSQPIYLLVNLVIGIGLGCNVNCGNLKGAKKDTELSECMHNCVVLGLLAGMLIALGGLFLSRPLLVAMKTPENILDNATLYMNIRLACGPVWMMVSFCTHMLYGLGETRLPTIISISSGLLNVLLNAVFVVGFGMGVGGVALATDLSLAAEGVALIYILFSPKGQYRMSVSKLKLQWKHVRNILSVGLPSGLSNIVFSLSNIMLQSCVNSFGAIVIAGNTAANDVASYLNLIITNLGSACVTATAQCHGARNYKRIDAIVGKMLPATMALVAVLCIPMTLFGKSLLRLYNEDPAVADMGYYKLMFNSWGYIANSAMLVFSGCIRGFRKANSVLICNLCGIIAPRLLWSWFVVPLMNTPTMLYLIFPISWFITAVIMGCVFRYYRKKLEPLPAV